MKLREILKYKGHHVHTIAPKASLKEVIDALTQNNCGSLVVIEQGRMCGIITERDILRAASQGTDLRHATVEQQMSSNLLTGKPSDEIGSVMGLMTEKRIRHLPILEDDELVGIISIGDVVKAQHDELTMENHYLKNYIQS